MAELYKSELEKMVGTAEEALAMDDSSTTTRNAPELSAHENKANFTEKVHAVTLGGDQKEDLVKPASDKVEFPHAENYNDATDGATSMRDQEEQPTPPGEEQPTPAGEEQPTPAREEQLTLAKSSSSVPSNDRHRPGADDVNRQDLELYNQDFSVRNAPQLNYYNSKKDQATGDTDIGDDGVASSTTPSISVGGSQTKDAETAASGDQSEDLVKPASDKVEFVYAENDYAANDATDGATSMRDWEEQPTLAGEEQPMPAMGRDEGVAEVARLPVLIMYYREARKCQR